jgi:hypothetical protein
VNIFGQSNREFNNHRKFYNWRKVGDVKYTADRPASAIAAESATIVILAPWIWYILGICLV